MKSVSIFAISIALNFEVGRVALTDQFVGLFVTVAVCVFTLTGFATTLATSCCATTA